MEYIDYVNVRRRESAKLPGKEFIEVQIKFKASATWGANAAAHAADALTQSMHSIKNENQKWLSLLSFALPTPKNIEPNNLSILIDKF